MTFILGHLPLAVSSQTQTHTISKLPNLTPKFIPNLFSLAIAITLTSPLPSHAIPSLNSSKPPPISLTTPFSQSKNLQIGLENGYVCQYFTQFWFLIIEMICIYMIDILILLSIKLFLLQKN